MDATPTMIDAPLAESIRAWFAEDPSRMTMMASRKFSVPEQAVVDTLVGTWPIVRLKGDSFPELMAAFPDFGPLRVFVRSRAAIMEVVGTFGGYSETGPFFNVQTDLLDMHLIPAEIGSIYAVEKIGHDSTFATHSFQFFDRQGDAAFKAFLWNGFPDVPGETIASFRALARRLEAS